MRTIVSLAVTAAALAAPAVASADTIAYVRDGSAQLIRADGSGNRAITTGGTTSVAWAPDGTLWAGKDRRLVHLDQLGRELGSIPVPDIEFVEDPAFDLDVSPDGSRIALTQVGASCDSGCSRPQASMIVDAASGALVGEAWAAADNLTWISNAQLFGAGGSGADFTRFNTDGTGSVFFNSPSADTSDVTIAPDGRSVAWVGYLGGTGFAVISGSTDPSPVTSATGSVNEACGFAPLLDEYRADPEFSPDSSKLAYAGPNGIQIADRPVRPSADCGAVPERTIAGPGASSMSWSSAALADAPTGGGGAGGSGGGGGAGGSTGGGRPGGGSGPAGGGAGPAAGVTGAAKVLRRSRTKGVTVRVSGLADGRATATMLLKRKAVGRARTTVRGGSATIRVKPAKRHRRALRKAKSVVLRVTPRSGAPVSVTVRF